VENPPGKASRRSSPRARTCSAPAARCFSRRCRSCEAATPSATCWSTWSTRPPYRRFPKELDVLRLGDAVGRGRRGAEMRGLGRVGTPFVLRRRRSAFLRRQNAFRRRHAFWRDAARRPFRRIPHGRPGIPYQRPQFCRPQPGRTSFRGAHRARALGWAEDCALSRTMRTVVRASRQAASRAADVAREPGPVGGLAARVGMQGVDKPVGAGAARHQWR
jgi:hypothetical protein